jgi:hypothetical protein
MKADTLADTSAMPDRWSLESSRDSVVSPTRVARARIDRFLFWLIAVAMFSGGLASPPLLAFGLLTAVAATIVRWQYGAMLLREPLFWLAAGLAAWVGLRAWMNLAPDGSLPGDAGAVWDHIRYTAVFPMVVGCWVAAFWHLRGRVLLLMCIGVLLYYMDSKAEIVRRLPIGDIPKGSYPELGLIAVTMAVLTFCFVPHFLRRLRSGAHRGDWLLVLLVAVACSASLTVFVFSQARSTWVSMAGLLLLALLVAGYLGCTRGDAVHRRRYLIGIGAVTLIVLTLGILLSDFIWWRLHSRDDMSALVAILDGRFGDQYEGSFAVRYRLLLQAFEDAMAHPWIGVGPAAIRETHQIDLVRGTWKGNYHSTYLNLVVALGIPWAILWVALHMVAVYRAVCRLLLVDRDVALGLGLLGASFVHFATLLFQVRIWSVQGSALYIILMSLVFAVLLRPEADASAAHVSGHAETCGDRSPAAT